MYDISGRQNPFLNASDDSREHVGFMHKMIGGLAEAIGTAPEKLLAMLIAGAQGYDALDPDGLDSQFEKTDGSLGPNEFTLKTGTTSIPIRWKAAFVGYFCEYIDVDVDGIGTNDVASLLVSVAGHQRRPYTVSVNGHFRLNVGRIITQGVVITISASSATDAASISVKLTAAALFPSPDIVSGAAAARLDRMPSREKGGAKEYRLAATTDSAKVAIRAVQKHGPQVARNALAQNDDSAPAFGVGGAIRRLANRGANASAPNMPRPR